MILYSTVKLILTLSCEESTRLASESLDRRLRRSERVAIKLHALCCKSCRRFLKQLRFLQQAIRSSAEDISAHPILEEQSLSTDARKRIQQALKNAEQGKSF